MRLVQVRLMNVRLISVRLMGLRMKLAAMVKVSVLLVGIVQSRGAHYPDINRTSALISGIDRQNRVVRLAVFAQSMVCSMQKSVVGVDGAVVCLQPGQHGG